VCDECNKGVIRYEYNSSYGKYMKAK
jgi:hypothetical protein